MWLHVVERNICINTCIKILRCLLGIQTMFAGSNPEIEEDRAYIYIYTEWGLVWRAQHTVELSVHTTVHSVLGGSRGMLPQENLDHNY